MGALDGIRVLDWTIWQQGPVATQILSDYGAEVIHIEHREMGDPGRGVHTIAGAPAVALGTGSCFFEYVNRGKKSIALDLGKEKGREIVYRLVSKSDVFVQNFRLGVAEKLGLDYETLRQHNPQLIYAFGSGYGHKGPENHSPTMDLLALARSGIMYAVGEPDAPPQNIKGSITDQVGAIVLALGIVMALVARDRKGIGQALYTSHFGSAITLEGSSVATLAMTGQVPPNRSRADATNPLFNIYCCQDGKWLACCMYQSDRYWGGLCKAMGRDELERDRRFQDGSARQENRKELIHLLDTTFSSKPREEWLAILEKNGCMAGPVNTLTDLLTDAQALDNGYLTEIEHPTLGRMKTVGLPIEFGETPGSVGKRAPGFGEHTEEVLLELAGYDWSDIERLKDEEVIV